MNEDLSDLDLLELLDRLTPVPEPAPISFWPQTEAWIWVGLVLLLVLLWLARRAISRWRSNAYRRAALREIAEAGSSPAALAEIMRRTALVAFPRSMVAGLYGEAWLAFLDRSDGGSGTPERRDFREGPGSALASAPYDVAEELPDDERGALLALCTRWIRRHRVEAGEPS